MKAANARHRVKGTELLVVVGAAASAGAIVARQLRSRARSAPETPPTAEATGTPSPLIGPPGVPHAWWNPSAGGEVRFLGGIRPGLPVETMLETVLGLMRDGKTFGPIPRNALQAAVLADEVGAGWY